MELANDTNTSKLDEYIASLVETHGLPKVAAQRLRIFILSGCFPLPSHLGEALECIERAMARLQQLDLKGVTDPQRLKRYDDIGRGIKSLVTLDATMKTLGLVPLNEVDTAGVELQQLSRPLYICLDLGLRQRRKHFHGQLFFQAFVLQDDVLQNDGDKRQGVGDAEFVSNVNLGSKIAEARHSRRCRVRTIQRKFRKQDRRSTPRKGPISKKEIAPRWIGWPNCNPSGWVTKMITSGRRNRLRLQT
jgi:hypothetical protein